MCSLGSQVSQRKESERKAWHAVIGEKRFLHQSKLNKNE